MTTHPLRLAQTLVLAGLLCDTRGRTGELRSSGSGVYGAAFDVTFSVAPARTFPISRWIYGVNGMVDVAPPYAGAAPWYGAALPNVFTLNRFGGNRLSAYNWETNYSNAGNDYNYQNDGFLSARTTPGEAVRSRSAATAALGAALLVTVPMLPYVAGDAEGVRLDTLDRTRAARLAQHFRANRPFKEGALSLAPDARDGFVSQDEFVYWATKSLPHQVGDSARPLFFSLDNEPDLWTSTHKEVQSDSGDDPHAPRLQTYEGFTSTTVAYARAVKSVAPGAVVFGPAVATYAGLATLGRYPTPDPQHGDALFVDVYLDRMRQAQLVYGRRLLDVLDVHWYPAAGTSAGEITNDYASQDEVMVRARLQAPRSLWDATYDEKSWVTRAARGPVRLLPRLRAAIAAHYPGTKIAVTEYYYGRGGDISGGVAQADVLGVFGREGVFAAALWPHAGVWAYKGNGAAAYAYVFGAFRAFRDYDGRGSAFGDVGVAATTSDPVNTSVYASRDARGRLVLVAINKTPDVVRAGLQVAGVALGGKTLQVWAITNGLPAPTRRADVVVGAGGAAVYAMPPMSVSTVVVP